MVIHRSKPFCVWSPLTTFRHAKHHLQGKNKGQHIQCIFNTAMFNQYRIECNQESMKNEERWKVWYQNFHFILFNIKAHFKTTRYTLYPYIGQATFSQYIGRTYKLSTFRNPTQNQLTNSNIKWCFSTFSMKFLWTKMYGQRQSCWSQVLRTDAKRRNRREHISVCDFANMRKLQSKIR